MLETLTAFGRKHTRAILDLAIILAVTIVVFRNWIFSPQWPAGGDVLGYISREYLYGKDYRWLFVWRPNSFGYPEGINVLDFFFMLLHFVAQNAVNTAKIFAVLSFALAGFGMYAFGYHCTRRNLPALAGSLIYILNGQFLTQLTEAHLDIMFSYALAPIIFLFLDRAFENGKLKDIVASSILFGIMLTGFQPQMILIYGVFLVLFMIINLLRPQKSLRFRGSVKFRLKTLVSICALTMVLSACFWMPLLFNIKAPYLSTNFSRGSLEDAYATGYKTFYEAFTLTGKERWGYANVVDVTKDAGLQILPVQAILLLVFAFAYVITLVFRLNRYSFFFGLSALISLILSMGPYSFESSFLWAWSHVPYFQSFRAISRWDMVVAFSNSFFVCVSSSILTDYIKKFLRRSEEKMEFGVNFGRDPQESRSLRVSLPSLDGIVRSARRFLYYSAIFVLIAVLMSGFVSTWFLFRNGLQVYTPPSDYFQPYEYLSNIAGNYKIVTVGRSTGDWYSTSGQDMDFIGGILTPVGWSHDLGYESTFITDKPSLQDGGLSPLSTDFVNYLRFYLARNNISRNLLELLGAFNYKYIVIPSYATDNERALFMSQCGGRLVYNQSDSLVLENEFYTPEIYAPTQSAFVLGGPESLSSLCDIDSFDLGKTAVILANQASNSPTIIDNHLNDTSAIVFTDAGTSDLITMSLLSMSPSDAHLIYLAGYGIKSSNTSAYWIRNDWWTNTGASVLGGSVLTTSGNNQMNITVELGTEGDYDMLIRAGFAANRGKLLVSIDGLPLAEVLPYSDFPSGLQWINLTSNFHLEAGSHLITLLNDGTGFNDLDAIAIVEHSKLSNQVEETINALGSFTGKSLWSIEAEKAFSKTLPEGWHTLAVPGEGYALHMEGDNIAPQASASASSVSNGLEAQYAIDGDPSTRWASSVNLPQWLEITFPTLQELYGVRINLERALAEDYRIQTWNGTDWIDQVVIENNSLLQRYHLFPQPVTTQKLRVLVTSAPAWNMVSIWELEIFSGNKVSSSTIFVPREGEYNFAARLFPDKESIGSFYLRVDDVPFSINCPTNESKAAWLELGSALLDAGEHNVSIFASGSVTLDKIGIYSASNNEHSIDDVFKSDLSTPSVSYEEVNPCKYVVHVNCTKPFLLVLSESHHPLWKAYVDNKEISPEIVDSLANGFYINRTGSFDVVLHFTGQEVADIGLVVSGGSTIFVVAVVLVKSAPVKKVRRSVMNRRLLGRPGPDQ
ncbi:discoidin domain-containing protein [Candidatus Bathyarchaeota archaeon]|nr:discoidin domain-containing protein [Candidatus Bathyarchaeota archaeon]